MTSHPNRSKRKSIASNPSPDTIRALRAAHGITQADLADVVHATLRAVQSWEQGDRPMHPAIYGYALARLGTMPPKWEPN